MRLRFIAFLIVMMATTATATYAQIVNDISATILPQPSSGASQPTTHGYYEVRVALTNNSASTPHDVTVTAPASFDGGRGLIIKSLTRTVRLAPNSSAVVSLFQPPVRMGGDDIIVNVDGKPLPLPASFSNHALPYYYGSSRRAVAVLTSISLADLGRQLTQRTDGQAISINALRSELPLDQWSNQWLGYTRFDAVMLGADEMYRLPVDVAEALRRYVQAGGTLLIIGGDWAVPEAWGIQQTDNRGFFTQHYVGLGMVAQITSAPQADINAQSLAQLIGDNNSTWESRPDLDSANGKLPVVEKLYIPVGGLLSLIILFALVIGPLNLWLLGRKRKRMWLLWTVPLISLLTCGAIWGYSLLAEGWRGQARTRTLTLLDQRNLSATTIGWAGYYAPLTPADGLRFSNDTEVTPLIERYYGYYYGSSSNNARPRTIDLTSQQHLAGGWVVARVPAYFMLRNTATPVRQRVVFSNNPDGTVAVTNGLGITLTRIIYVNDAGHPFTLQQPLLAGEKANMTRLPGEAKRLNMVRIHELYTGDWMDNFDRLDLSFTGRDPIKTGIRPFGPGMYLAQTDQPNPFLQPGMGNLKKQQHQTYILGITEPSLPAGAEKR